MIISHRHKFIFIKTRKTAGTSIEIFLSHFLAQDDIITPISEQPDENYAQNYYGLFNPFREFSSNWYKNLQAMRDFALGRKYYNHIPAYRVKARLTPKIWGEYFKFCIDRNPWDKTISHYFFRKNAFGEHFSLDEYMERGDFCLNYPLYMDAKQEKVIVDRVLKYENLQGELADVFNQLRIPFTGDLGIRAKSSQRETRRPYWEVLSQNQIEKLNVVFEKEIKLHGYCPQPSSL